MTSLWKILIVDDDEVDRESLRRKFEESDHEMVIQEASDGGSGLAAMANHNFDCILLDFLLPDMTGNEFLTILSSQEAEPHCAVVMLTGEGDEEIAIEAMRLGAYDYLIKGSQRVSSNLIDTVRRSIEHQNLIRDKKKSDLELRESEERFRSLVESTVD